jgi:catechol 2,3-dioxygenase-like lactoylglutathione lyase family enzyme
MDLNHVGIINRTGEEAIRFYRDFFGLEITRESVIPTALSVQIFGVSADIKVIVFERNGTKIEVFIAPDYKPATPDIIHTGFFVDDITEVLKKAGRSGIEVITGRTEEKTVYFIRDLSGNLIEVKQKQ